MALRLPSGRVLTLAAMVSVTGSLVIAGVATLFAVTNPQTTDFAGVDAVRHAQLANLGCVYSRSVQLAGAHLVPGVVAPAASTGLPWHFNEPLVTTLLAAPFTSLGISSAVNLWELVLWVSIAACAVFLWRDRAGLPRWLMAAVVGALLLNEIANTDFSLAQNEAVLLLAALFALYLMRRHHDVAAGALLGLVAVKPQLVFLAFIALLFTRRWRIAASCAVTTCAVVGIGVLMAGPSCSLQWLSSATQLGEFQIGIGLPDTVARVTGNAILTEVAFLALSAISVGVLWRIRSRVDTPLLVSIALALAVVIGVHTLAYDVLFLVPLGMAVAHARPWLVVAAGWAFTLAQQFDSTFLAARFFSSTPVKATELVPFAGVALAIVFLVRSPRRAGISVSSPLVPRGVVPASPSAISTT